MPARHRKPPAPPPIDPPIDEVLADTAAVWAAVQRYAGEYIAVVDRQGIIHAVNRSDPGVPIEEIVGHSFVRFTTPESTERLKRALDEVFRSSTAQTTESTVRLPDGTHNYFSIRLGPILRDGRAVAAMVFADSIRTLKASEEALQKERVVLRRLIDIQERERQLVSYEIHDGLAQYIAGAIMHFEAQQHALKGRVPREFEQGMRLLRAAADESRRLIAGLRPPALDELGIVDAIESLVADARIEIPRVDFVHDLPAERLPVALETVIFRVVQESLTNARRHSRAKSAEVRVEHVPGGVHVLVRDDGRGFKPAASQDRHFGLEGIRQRCRLFGASPTIVSAPRRGTTVEVTLPLPGPESA